MRDRQNTRAWLVAALLAALSVFPIPALAQDATEPQPAPESQPAPNASDTALARSLFESGMEAVDAGDFTTAADRLGRSLEIRASVVVRANYALALIELGRLVEASEHFQTVQRETDAGSDAHGLAATQLARIQPLLGHLHITVTGSRVGVETLLDGRVLNDAALEVPLPSDPGTHVVVLRRSSRELATSEATIVQGETARVRLVVPPPSPEELAEAEAARVRMTEQERIVVRESSAVEEEPWFWILVGTLAAGAIAAIVAAIVVSGQDTMLGEGSSGITFQTLRVGP